MTDGRLVVLGASGFVGSHTVRRAHDLGMETLALGSRDIDLLAPDAADSLARLLESGDTVVHGAAIAPSKSAADLSANLAMTQSLSWALAEQPVAQLIVVSSDAVYGSQSGVVDEGCACCPDSLHGVMSLGRELLSAESGTAKISIIRPAPIYGFGDTHNSYGPNRFARQGLECGEIAVFGAGEAVRDHVFVEDVADVIVRSAMGRVTGIVNVASGASMSFAGLADLVRDAIGPRVAVKSVGSESAPTFRTFDVAHLVKTFPELVPTAPKAGVERMVAAMRG